MGIIKKIRCLLFWADKIDDIYEELYELRKDIDRLEDDLYSEDLKDRLLKEAKFDLKDSIYDEIEQLGRWQSDFAEKIYKLEDKFDDLKEFTNK